MPYIARAQFYREVPAYTYTDENGKEVTEYVENRTTDYMYAYGLMTADGRIITDAFFDYFITHIDKAGNVVWSLGKQSEEEMYGVAASVLVGGDGTWMQTYDGSVNVQFVYSNSPQGLFVCKPEEKDDPVLVYDYHGTLLADLADDKIESDYGGYDAPELLYYDGESLIFERENPDEDYGYSYAYVRRTRDGKETTLFETNDRINEVFGDLLLSNGQYTAYASVYDLNGRQLVAPFYGQIVTNNAAQRLYAWDTDREEAFVMDAACRELARFPADEARWQSLSHGKNGVLFFDEEAEQAYSAEDGQPLDFGLRHLSHMELLYGYADNDGQDVYLLLQTKDDRWYLGEPDGETLTEICKPRVYEKTYDDGGVYRDTDIFIRGTHILLATEDDGWYLFDRETGEKTQFDDPGWELHYDEAVDVYNYLELIDDYLIVNTELLLEDFVPSTRDLYDLHTLQPVLRQVFVEQSETGYLLVATSGYFQVCKGDSVILKIKNNTMI